MAGSGSHVYMSVGSVSGTLASGYMRHGLARPRGASAPEMEANMWRGNYMPDSKSCIRLFFHGHKDRDDEVYFFPSSRRAILGTLPAARRASPLPRPLRLSQHVTCHGGVSVTSLRHAGSAGLCPTTSSGWARRSPVALTFTRLTLPRACLRFGCRSSLCPVSLLTRKPNSHTHTVCPSF